MKHIFFLALAFAGAAQAAAPVVEMPQDAPRVFIHSAEAGPIIMLPYQGAQAAPVVAQAAAPVEVAKSDAPADSDSMTALVNTTK